MDFCKKPLALLSVLGLNLTMLAEDKMTLACFIELSAAAAGSGFRGKEQEYSFDDSDTSALKEPLQDSLEHIAGDIYNCTACELCKTRVNAVPGEGILQPLVMVIGEGPGGDEDKSGRPFVGRAGQLLDKMLISIGLSRDSNCFIANVIKCRPPQNRDPQPQEISACFPFLERQVSLLKPKFILCAGRFASQTLFQTNGSIGMLRGKIKDVSIAGVSIPSVVTYHPSALLRSEELKRPAWEDLKLLRSALVEAKLMKTGTE